MNFNPFIKYNLLLSSLICFNIFASEFEYPDENNESDSRILVKNLNHILPKLTTREVRTLNLHLAKLMKSKEEQQAQIAQKEKDENFTNKVQDLKRQIAALKIKKCGASEKEMDDIEYQIFELDNELNNMIEGLFNTPEERFTP